MSIAVKIPRADDDAPCDELEPVDGTTARARWIEDPAGVVHLLVEDTRATSPASSERDG